MQKPLQVAENIFSVGCRDWDIRDFHGYSTYEGTTYNAFLIVGKKNILIDTVKEKFAKELLFNISRIIDPKEIDIVISNHTELDHSGAIPYVMKQIGEDKPIYCSKMGEKNLKAHFHKDFNFQVVKTGDKLETGDSTFSFLETRMLHWPDSMFTYFVNKAILFSSDAFGQHYAADAIFDDETDDYVMVQAKKYYANILMLYSPQVQALLKNVTKMNLKIDMICPDHGIIWRKNPARIIQAYDKWSRQEPTKKAIVIFDSMWESTTKMARAITSGFESEEVTVKLMNTRKWHRSDILTEVLEAGAIAVGSPTLNNGIFPVIADVMTYLKGLKPKNKLVAAFGSYGWSGEAVKILNNYFAQMGSEIVDDGIKVRYVPDENELEKCFKLGVKMARLLKERLA